MLGGKYDLGKKFNMKVSNIDADFVELIDAQEASAFKLFASCDGERYVGIRDMTVLSKMLGQKFGFQTYKMFEGKEFTGEEFSVTI